MDNQQLWQTFLSGDKNSLSEIFLQYYDDLYRYGLKLSGNRNLVEDAIQDMFLKLWKNRSNLANCENPKPYLFRSLRNHIIDSLELKKPTITIDKDFEHPVSFIYSPDDFVSNMQVTEEMRTKVIDALNKLNPRQREAIYLRYIEELDFGTIAGIMEINVQSVRNTLHRGISALRDLMLLNSFLLMVGKSFLVV